jgi:N-acetylneuraminic acid mutarotase
VSALSWADSDGNLWLFGGDGLSESGNGLLNDLWKYRPATNDWTWMSGSKLGSSNTLVAGIYGTMGTPSPTNAPGQREFATTWTDAAGNFWMFGGLGTDSAGSLGFLNDLWKYNPRTGAWTWVSGSSTVNAAGVGTKGVPANSNVPEARQLAIGWRDQDGNLWLFGGDSARGGHLSDLWQYNLASGQWTWISGSSGLDDRGVYGTPKLPAATNVPGARSGGVSWIDHAGNLWHFGGLGVDSNGNLNLLNDLWKYLR